MTVNIHGKEYHTVAERVRAFREVYPYGMIRTQLVSADSEGVCMKAEVWVRYNDKEHLLGTGYAEELRAASNINRTSAMENCETSAIGRALAAAGYGGDGEYATANEVQNAIAQQHEMDNASKSPGEVTFPKGQYRDKTIEWVWPRDPAYVDRISKAKNTDSVVIACRNYIAMNADAHAQKMADIRLKKEENAKEKQA